MEEGRQTPSEVPQTSSHRPHTMSCCVVKDASSMSQQRYAVTMRLAGRASTSSCAGPMVPEGASEG